MFKLFFLILILIASTHLYAQKSLQVEDKVVYTSNSTVPNISKDDELYKKIIATYNLFNDRAAQNVRVLASLGVIYIPCSRFKAGTYYGEVYNNMPDGYGTYLFEDSSYYCGSFYNGQVNGVGVLFVQPNTIFVATWLDGKTAGDYYAAKINQAQNFIYINSNRNGENLQKVGIHFSDESIAVQNYLYNVAKTKMVLNTYIKGNFFKQCDPEISYSTDIDDNRTPLTSTTFKKSSTTSSFFNTHTTVYQSLLTSKPDLEKIIGNSIPAYLIPMVSIEKYNNLGNYFGRLDNGMPDGFGTFTQADNPKYLKQGIFNKGKIDGFKTEINLQKASFIFLGKYETIDKNGFSYNTGKYANFIYENQNNINIQLGNITDNVVMSGITVVVSPTKKSVIFHNAAGTTKAKGYVFLPLENAIYRGELLGTQADGNGEIIAIGKGLGAPANINKCVFKKSSFVKNDNNIPAWQTPLFTDIFNTPLGLIDDIK